MPTDTNNFIDRIFSPKTVRSQAKRIYDAALNGGTHFSIDESRIEDTANFVLDVMKSNYPSLEVPYHSRWRHFDIEGSTLISKYQERVSGLSARERARTGLDLIITSVLVDAGAGASWAYTEPETDLRIGRSEGLGLASLALFLSGKLSNDGTSLRVDGPALQELSKNDFEVQFQVNKDNPLLAVEGRVMLLQKLGEVIKTKGSFPTNRLGDLVDLWFPGNVNTASALNVFRSVIDEIGEIWPGRLTHDGRNLGDTWLYSPFGDGVDAHVPFHKLSQWLTYSIIETLESCGFIITDIDQLTGLAEYRNGGLFIDNAVLQLRDPSLLTQSHNPSTDLIIEWRALTVVLLDEVGKRVQKTLNLTSNEFPLVKVLEGGTWAAGRRLAADLRPNSTPPIRIQSDGTVF